MFKLVRSASHWQTAASCRYVTEVSIDIADEVWLCCVCRWWRDWLQCCRPCTLLVRWWSIPRVLPFPLSTLSPLFCWFWPWYRTFVLSPVSTIAFWIATDKHFECQMFFFGLSSLAHFSHLSGWYAQLTYWEWSQIRQLSQSRPFLINSCLDLWERFLLSLFFFVFVCLKIICWFFIHMSNKWDLCNQSCLSSQMAGYLYCVAKKICIETCANISAIFLHACHA